MKILKKLLLGIIAVAATVTVCTICASADVYGDYEYTVLSDGTVRITEYNGTEMKLNVPSVINGKTVTEIGSEAFKSNAAISITIPDTVRTIGEKAFYYCSRLTSFVIPEGVVTISGHAFYDCSRLKSVTVPSTVVTVGNNVFRGCDSLEAIYVHADNKNYCSVGGIMFNKAKTILVDYPAGRTAVSYTIPSTVTEIGPGAFLDCNYLEKLAIPSNVKKIGNSAFDSCYRLKTVTVASGVEIIGTYAFYDTAIRSISIPDTVTTIGSGAFSYCTGLESVKLPAGLTTINSDLFSNCRSLKSISLPTTVKNIYSYAFEHCTSLATVTVPASVSYMDDDVFIGATKLTDINVAAGNENYCSYGGVLYDIDKTNLITYPAGKTNTAYTVPDTVKNIRSYAFGYAKNLTYISIPDTVEIIEDNAFAYCEALKSMKLPSKIKSVSNYTFCGCYSLTSVVIPEGVKFIGYEAFHYCYALESVTLPSTLTTLNRYSFYKCDSLKTVAIPKSVTTIPEYCFAGCLNLTAVYVPDTVTKISALTFQNANDGLTICGIDGSYAQTYAGDNKIPFKAVQGLSGTPTLTAAAGNGCVQLSWSKVPGALYYNIYRYKDGGYTKVTSVNATTAKVTGLTNNYSYYYAVEAVGAFEKTLSANVKSTPYAIAKPVVTASAGNTSVKLSWKAVSGATFYQVIRYKNGEYISVAFVNTTSLTIKGLTNNAEYTYLVKAGNDMQSVLSAPVTVKPLVMAKPVVTAKAGNGEATLSWKAVAGANSYQIIRFKNNAYTVVATVSSTSATVKGLTNNYEYTYLVKAVNDLQASLSAAVKVTPFVLGTPKLTASAGNGEVKLSWTKAGGAQYYNVVRYKDGKYTTVATVSGTTATVKGLTNGFEYTYLIMAVGGSQTTVSNAVSVTPFKLGTSILRATIGNTKVMLSWTKASGATSYDIVRYKDGVYTKVATVGGSTLSATVTGLTNGYEYTYLVVASGGTQTSASNAVKVMPKS